MRSIGHAKLSCALLLQTVHSRSLDQDEKSSGKRHESHAATTREMINRELQNGKMFGGKGWGDESVSHEVSRGSTMG